MRIGRWGEGSWSEGLAAALGRLTQLTQLRMHAACAQSNSMDGIRLGGADSALRSSGTRCTS